MVYKEKIYPKILVLGDGLLGSEIIKQTGWEYLSNKKDGIDVISKFQETMNLIHKYNPDIILNCIGYTDTYSLEKDLHWKINYQFVVNLVNCFFGKIVHISTDYIYANSKGNNSEKDVPVHQETWYSYTKLLSDAYVQLNKNNLIIRCSFKPKPLSYDKAYDNVKGNFDYVDVIAKQIIRLINEDRKSIWNIGTEFKSIYDLAKQTKPDVKDWYNDKLPTIKMDLTKYNNRKI